MSDVVIRAEGLGKKYLIGHQAKAERYTALRDVAARAANGLVRSARDMLAGKQLVTGDEVEEFWALKDVNFEIKRGDMVGIIGRNGAGKSTLLKILSRITEPTTGRVEIKGRVASLLEVGTGFHPELTGRENISLNGAILGMSRAEIKKKFDEIVAFAEVEKFLDTPVKHYSSGMYVRLAFAVAAHLEPEILVVDEVLAVGDAEFQKRCLGKMGEVAGLGRTVLFVSHSMVAIRALCKNGILMREGSIATQGPVTNVIDDYLTGPENSAYEMKWLPEAAPGDETARLYRIEVSQFGREPPFSSAQPVQVEMEVWINKLERDLNIGFELFYQNGQTVFWSHYTDDDPGKWPVLNLGLNVLTAEIAPNQLNGGTYMIAPGASIHRVRSIYYLPPTISFDVHLAHSASPYWTAQSDGQRQGVLAPLLNWQASTHA